MTILSERQKLFLRIVGESPLRHAFYLTGGTALAEFYLHHRYSEDLDFFSEQEVDTLGVNAFFKLAESILGFKKLDFQQSFNRNLYFLHFADGEILKTEFTYFPFTPIEKGPLSKFGKLQVDSILDIAVNKLFTIYQRTKARDYIDLYCLCTENKFTIADLAKKAKVKFDWHIDPLQLGTQFMNAEKAEDYPRMIKKLEPKAWQNWFREQAQFLGKDILKK